MYRVRRRGKPWRTRWPLNKWWPQRVDQRFCRECNMPYVNGPLPKEIAQFHSRDVSALLFPAGSWRRGQCSVRLGRWKPSSGRLYLSEFVPCEELDDVENALAQVREYLDEFVHCAQPRRKAHR
jgi:hypothetical protein